MTAEFLYCPRCGGDLRTRELGGMARQVCRDQACGHVFWNNPVPVVAGIVELPEGVVLARNKGWPEGFFGLITGYLEAGETPEAGICREVEEEIGLVAEIQENLGHYSFFRKNQLLICYHLTAAGEPVLGDELAEIRVIPVDRLRPWDQGTGPALRDWLAARRRLPTTDL